MDPVTGRTKKVDHGLDATILRLCKKFYAEGIPILYGENIFKYRLRDLLAPPPVDVEGLVNNHDAVLPTPADESGSEYEPDERAAARPPAKRPRRSRKGNRSRFFFEGDINIEKYVYYFRHIVLDAQHNRAGKDFMHSMAEAIGIFAKHVNLDGGSRQTVDISSLKVIIEPGRGSDNQPSFTFVDFFQTDSPVVNNIRKLKPQFVHTDIMSAYLNMGRKNRRLTIDMRPQRIQARIHAGVDEDEWKNDIPMTRTRSERIKQSNQALNSLSNHIGSCCKEYSEGEGPRRSNFFWFTDIGADDDFEGDHDLDDMESWNENESQYWE
jgi:hypothetical protein